jgi:hypothetical protein
MALPPSAAIVRCGENREDYLDTLQALEGACFSEFTIYSTAPWEIDVTVIECSGLTIGQLYAEVVEGQFQALTADPNGDYVLNSLDKVPAPDTEGFRQYFLGDTNHCFQLEKRPFSGGYYGSLPAKVRVYDCDGNETVYTDAIDTGRFFAGDICFNSFALAPADNSFYIVKVRVSECAEEVDTCEASLGGDGLGRWSLNPNLGVTECFDVTTYDAIEDIVDGHDCSGDYDGFKVWAVYQTLNIACLGLFVQAQSSGGPRTMRVFKNSVEQTTDPTNYEEINGVEYWSWNLTAFSYAPGDVLAVSYEEANYPAQSKCLKLTVCDHY